MTRWRIEELLDSDILDSHLISTQICHFNHTDSNFDHGTAIRQIGRLLPHVQDDAVLLKRLSDYALFFHRWRNSLALPSAGVALTSEPQNSVVRQDALNSASGSPVSRLWSRDIDVSLARISPCFFIAEDDVARFTPDGTLLVVGGMSLVVLFTSQLELLESIDVPTPIYRLDTCGNEGVVCIEKTTSVPMFLGLRTKELRRIEGKTAYRIAGSPNGTCFATLTHEPGHGRLVLWSSYTMERLWDEVTDIDQGFMEVCFDSTGQSVIACTSGRCNISVWSTTNGQRLRILRCPFERFNDVISFAMRLHPDGRRLFVILSFLPVSDTDSSVPVDGPERAFPAVRVVDTWDLREEAVVRHRVSLRARDIFFGQGPDDVYLQATDPESEQILVAWNHVSGEYRPFQLGELFTERFCCALRDPWLLCLSQDFAFAAHLGHDRESLFPSLPGQSRLGLLDSAAATAVAWSPDGSRLVSASIDIIKIWDLATGVLSDQFPVNYSTRRLFWREPSHVVAVHSHGFTVRDTTTWSVTREWVSPVAFILAEGVSSDGTHVAMMWVEENENDEYYLGVWDTRSGCRIWFLDSQELPLCDILDICLRRSQESPCSIEVICGGMERIESYDIVSGMRSVLVRSGIVGDMMDVFSFSPDGLRYARWISSRGTLEVCELLDIKKHSFRNIGDPDRDSGTDIDRSNGGDLPVERVILDSVVGASKGAALSFSPDGSRLAVADFGAISVFDLNLKRRIALVTEEANAVAWCDDKRFATATHCGMVQVWALTSVEGGFLGI
eukprot:Rmarinus@m.16618